MYKAKIKNLNARKATKLHKEQYPEIEGYIVHDKKENISFSVGECIDRRHAILIIARGGGDVLRPSFLY